ncbi:MAG: DNA topoisomerase VI subunit B [Candidatus Bathyarchaeia archaeon]
MAESKESFAEISPADFFYRNRDIAGFTNPARAIYAAIRELVENSLDACELYQVPPEIYIRISSESSVTKEGPAVYRLRVEDNGSGVPPEYIPSAFGQVLFGSKYRIRQTRGTFGLGGKMAILYGQITTHRPVRVISSTGSKIYEYELIIDIQRNRPVVLSKKVYENANKWHGTVVDFALEGDYFRAMAKILEYLKETAIVNPYANIMAVDPRGRLYRFERVTEKMPPPPQETLPHPYGTDVETIRRLMHITE